jgi:hypothetical protein
MPCCLTPRIPCEKHEVEIRRAVDIGLQAFPDFLAIEEEASIIDS